MKSITLTLKNKIFSVKKDTKVLIDIQKRSQTSSMPKVQSSSSLSFLGEHLTRKLPNTVIRLFLVPNRLLPSMDQTSLQESYLQYLEENVLESKLLRLIILGSTPFRTDLLHPKEVVLDPKQIRGFPIPYTFKITNNVISQKSMKQGITC